MDHELFQAVMKSLKRRWEQSFPTERFPKLKPSWIETRFCGRWTVVIIGGVNGVPLSVGVSAQDPEDEWNTSKGVGLALERAIDSLWETFYVGAVYEIQQEE